MAFGQKWGYGWLWMAMAMICRFFMVLYGSMGLEFLGSWFHGMSSFMPWSDGWIMLDPSLCPRWTRLAFPRTSYSHSEGGSGSDPEHLLGILTNMHMSISHYQSTYHQILMIKICSWYQSISIDWVICHSSPYSSSNIIKYHQILKISSNIIQYWKFWSCEDIQRVNELEISWRWDRRLSPKMPSYGPSKRWGDRWPSCPKTMGHQMWGKWLGVGRKFVFYMF
jgi:hypothetical protein